MSTYVAIIRHTPAEWPASDKANFERVSGQIGRLESLSRETGVEVSAIHVLLPGHTGIVILQAPAYETAVRFMVRVGIQDWNDVTLYRSCPPQDVMQASGERLAARD